MHDKPHLVFVYGTLKKGHRNHHVLEGHAPKFIGEAVTVSNQFDLVVQDWMTIADKFTPVVYKTNDKRFFISGELYEVNNICFKKLDELEEVDVSYTREQIEVSCNERNYNAWIYLQMDVSHSLDRASFVANESGLLSWVYKG